MQPHRLLVPCIVFQSISSSAMVAEQWHTALLMPISSGASSGCQSHVDANLQGQGPAGGPIQLQAPCPYPMLHVVYGEAF
jgi:hypothetical protein